MNQVPNRMPAAGNAASPAAIAAKSPAKTSSEAGSRQQATTAGQPFSDAMRQAGTASNAPVVAGPRAEIEQFAQAGPQLIRTFQVTRQTEGLGTAKELERDAPEQSDLELLEPVEPSDVSGLPNAPTGGTNTSADDASDIDVVVSEDLPMLDAHGLSSRADDLPGGRPIAAQAPAEAAGPPQLADEAGPGEVPFAQAGSLVTSQHVRDAASQAPSMNHKPPQVAPGDQRAKVEHLRADQRTASSNQAPDLSADTRTVGRAGAIGPGVVSLAADTSGVARFKALEGTPAVKITVLGVETHLQVAEAPPGRLGDGQPAVPRTSATPVTVAAHLAEPTSSTEPLKVIKLQLEPGALGSLTVRVARQGDGIQITIQPQLAHTAGMLRSDAAMLNAVLQSAAPLPDTFNVQVLDPQPASQSGFTDTSAGSRAGASAHHDQQADRTSTRSDDPADDGRATDGENDEQGKPGRKSGRGELYL